LDAVLAAGTIVDMANDRGVDRYEILREVGRGGTATVYLARQTDLSRLVALKELSALSAADPKAAKRFVRESRLAGSLNHPSIVTVHDYFEDHATAYIAMEYLERGSLRPMMRGLSFGQVAGVLEAVLGGLAHAQQHGIVHRDMKPENLMVTADGRVKIADFGIAKAIEETQASTMLTAEGTTIGTPTYMAPEQALAEEIGPWTDMYAVGVIAYEMLAGKPPFSTSGAPTAILLRHVNDEPPKLEASDPRLTDWVGDLLVKDPAKRPDSASSAWLMFEEIVIDRLGPKWRRSAMLGVAGADPSELPTAKAPRGVAAAAPGPSLAVTAAPRGVPLAATVAPRTAATARRRRPAAAAAAAPLGLPFLHDSRAARRLASAVLVLLAVIVLIAGAITLPGGGGGGGEEDDSPPQGTTQPASSRQQQPQQSKQTRRSNREESSGVGDSQSDDPSDDEPDGGEP
jgi:protein kinase-like protein